MGSGEEFWAKLEGVSSKISWRPCPPGPLLFAPSVNMYCLYQSSSRVRTACIHPVGPKKCSRSKTCWHPPPQTKFECAPLELVFTRYRNNLRTVGNLTVKNSLQDFDAKEMYLHSKNRSVSFLKHWKMFYLIILQCSHDAVSKMCQLEFRFQNLPVSKSTSKKCAVFVWTGGLSVTFFTVFKMCRYRVNAVLIIGSGQKSKHIQQATAVKPSLQIGRKTLSMI